MQLRRRGAVSDSAGQVLVPGGVRIPRSHRDPDVRGGGGGGGGRTTWGGRYLSSGPVGGSRGTTLTRDGAREMLGLERNWPAAWGARPVLQRTFSFSLGTLGKRPVPVPTTIGSGAGLAGIDLMPWNRAKGRLFIHVSRGGLKIKKPFCVTVAAARL